ncbi:MAG: hypothetical protein ABW252_01710 [Polyangiales bacterium]
MLLSPGWLGATGCAEPDTAEVQLAELALPLTVVSDGTTYRLRGTFLVRGSPEEAAPVVRSVRSDDVPGAMVRVALPPGPYYVFLAPGWRLTREAAQGSEAVDATLATSNPLSATLDEGRGALLTFRFAVAGAPLIGDGELRVGIDVERDVCGDGQRGASEACDDGTRNGGLGRCDGSCRFVCAGACPLRVDPGAPTGGSGATWSSALRNLQRAVDTQTALGGGEVWVRGGDRDVLDGIPNHRLVVPSKVRLRGGFRGNETRIEQRDPAYARTRVGTRSSEPAAMPLDPQNNLVRIEGREDVLIERFHLEDHGYPLRIANSRRITLRSLSMRGYHRSQILDATVRIENARLEGAGYGYLEAYDSQLAIVDARFVNGAEYSGLDAVRSRVSLERVTTDGPVLLTKGSRGLFIDSTFRGSAERAGYVDASDALVIGSQFVNDGVDSFPAAAPLAGESLLVFNSSFVRLSNGPVGGAYPRAAAIDAPTLEVAASTFFLNHCEPGFQACNYDISTSGASPVHNSLFVHPAMPSPGAPPDQSVFGTTASRANCVSNAPDGFDAEPNGSGRVLARKATCPNRGDAALLERARQRLIERAKPFLAAPFSVDLSRYERADWWRGESAVLGQCGDADAPEPGRHFAVACTR